MAQSGVLHCVEPQSAIHSWGPVDSVFYPTHKFHIKVTAGAGLGPAEKLDWVSDRTEFDFSCTGSSK